MKKRNKIIFITLIIVLISTGIIFGKKKEDTTNSTEKQKFFITTQMLWKDLQGSIKKTATVQAASDITISAQVAWRVSSIKTSLGEKVSQKELLIALSDTAGTYTLNAQRAALSLQSAANAYTINQQNLEKQIEDAQIAYNRTSVSTDNSIIGNSDSTAQLQLKQLEQNLEKSRLDYDIKVKSDQQTLDNYINTATNVYSDVTNLMLDVIDQADKFLGYTLTNSHLNNGFEIYIGVKNDNAKYLAEQKLAELIRQKDKLQSIGNSITLQNVTSYLSDYKKIVETINEMTVAMKNVLNATTIWGSLTQAWLDGYIASFSALQSKASGISSSITAQVNSIDTFINTYKDNQASLKKQIELLETQISVNRKQIEEGSKNASYSLEQSKNNLNYLSTTKDANISSLRNSLSQAQVAYQEAQLNVSKLSVQAPIEGIIGEILVDKWQDVTPGTPLIKMVSQWKEIIIRATADEKNYIILGQTVDVVSKGESFSGTVTEIGTVADDSGNYLIKVLIDDDARVDIGSFVNVYMATQQWNAIIPLKAVTIVDNNRWQIFIWESGAVQTKTVSLGSVYGDGIEVIDVLPQGTKLIISDMSNYDPEKMTIEEK